MDIPAGRLVREALPVEGTDFFPLLRDLKESKFSGYLAITTYVDEIEEGVEIFDSGKPVASTYEYFSYHASYQGREAWGRIVNASAASSGVIDVVELSPE